MASGGGGTGKVMSGPLKGKVAYFSESEIKDMGAKAGLSYAEAFAAMKSGDNTKFNTVLKNSVTVFDVKDSQATKNAATSAKYAADQAAAAKLAEDGKKITEAQALSSAYADVTYDPNATGAKYTVKSKETGEVMPAYSLGAAQLKAKNVESAAKAKELKKNADLLNKDAVGTGITFDYSTGSNGYIAEGGPGGVDYFDNVSAAQAYVIKAKKNQADELDKQTDSINAKTDKSTATYSVFYDAGKQQFELYQGGDLVASHATAAEMQTELDDLNELIDAANAPAAPVVAAAPKPKAPKAAGANKNQTVTLPGSLPGMTNLGETQITGDVYGDFVIHKSDQTGGPKSKYTITHIPTGYKIGDPTSKGEANTVTAKLLELDGVDWGSTNPLSGLSSDKKSEISSLMQATWNGSLKGENVAPTAAPSNTAVQYGAASAADLPAVPTTPKAPKAQTLTVKGGQELTGEVYGDFIVHKATTAQGGKGYAATHIPSGATLGAGKSKAETAAFVDSVLSIPGSDWGVQPSAMSKSQQSDYKALFDQYQAGIYKGAKTIPSAPPSAAAIAAGAVAGAAGTPAPKAAPKPKASKGGLPKPTADALPTASGLGDMASAPQVYVKQQYEYSGKNFAMPKNDSVTLSYPDGSTHTVTTAGKTLASANTKLNSYYKDWAAQNGPGTPGYKALNDNYQTPVYKAINMYLRWKGLGKSDAEINTLLKTDPEVTYNGSVFNGGYGYKPGNDAKYTVKGMQQLVNDINKSVSSHPMPQDTIMYRGQAKNSPFSQWLNKAKVGEISPKDPAYSSLSANANHSMMYATKSNQGGPGVMTTVIVRKGTKGAYLPAKGGVTSEYEYLLGAGTTMRLLSKTKDPASGLWHAVVEVYEQD